jgi:2-methylaconitate cis-trans-isomerase PrpF
MGVDVDYTFVQVAVGQETVDFSGNCGNMCAGVGPFALQEGLVRARPGEKTVSRPILIRLSSIMLTCCAARYPDFQHQHFAPHC